MGNSHVTSRHLHQIDNTAYDATIPALQSRARGVRAISFNQASAWEHRGSNSVNLIPHVKGVKEAFGICCLHELRGTIGAIADELAAEILCDWALVSASEAVEQSRFELETSRVRVAQLVRARDCQSLGRRFDSV